MENTGNELDIASRGITQRMKMRDVMRMVIDKVMRENSIDVFVNPTITVPPAMHGGASQPQVNNRPTGRFPLSADLGLPEITVPAGFQSVIYEPKLELNEKQDNYRSVANNTEQTAMKHPMPYGISFWAGPGDEPIVIEVASIYEQATKHRMAPPAFGPVKKTERSSCVAEDWTTRTPRRRGRNGENMLNSFVLRRAQRGPSPPGHGLRDEVRSWAIILAGAVCGAMLGVAIVFAAANQGFLPRNAGGSDIRAYLLSHPELVSQMNDLLQARQQAEADRAGAAAVEKIGMAAFFDPRLAFVTGPAGAKKSLVEFYDYDCPYCRVSLPAVIKFYDAHKNDTRFSFIELPIPQLHGPSAVLAARASLAARLQPDKYVPFHFALMSEQGVVDEHVIFADAQKAGVNVAKLKADMQSREIEKVIDLSRALAQKAGIDGTPTFIANGVMHPGAVDAQTLSDMTKTG